MPLVYKFVATSKSFATPTKSNYFAKDSILEPPSIKHNKFEVFISYRNA